MQSKIQLNLYISIDLCNCLTFMDTIIKSVCSCLLQMYNVDFNLDWSITTIISSMHYYVKSTNFNLSYIIVIDYITTVI